MRVLQHARGSGGHVALIGEWDPLGPAHEQLLRSTVSSAALSGRSVLVVTLEPGPASRVFGSTARPPFDDVAARLLLQERCGVQSRVTVGLTPSEVERCGAEHLLAELCRFVPIEELVLGAYQTLGVGSLGDPAAVDAAARKRGIPVRRLDPLDVRPRTADARRLLANGYLQQATSIVGRHFFWARPHDEVVRLPWPPGWYRALPYAAPSPADRLTGDDISVEMRRSDGSSYFFWPTRAIPWLGFAAGPQEVLDHGV